jgi:hypothetical protein
MLLKTRDAIRRRPAYSIAKPAPVVTTTAIRLGTPWDSSFDGPVGSCTVGMRTRERAVMHRITSKASHLNSRNHA